MTPEFGIGLAFLTGVLGAFHCLGMCSGIAAGFFVSHGLQHKVLPHLIYHGTRILVYTVLGVAGALLSRVLVQTGILGKGQGILMMVAGVLITLIGLGLLGAFPWLRRRECQADRPRVQEVRFLELESRRRHWAPVVAGLFNGLVPCSLVFSVAVKATASADPVQAGVLMLAFGLGTLPTMGAVGAAGALIGSRVRGIAARLTGLAVMALGAWTFYEGLVFFDIMRGLGDW